MLASSTSTRRLLKAKDVHRLKSSKTNGEAAFREIETLALRDVLQESRRARNCARRRHLDNSRKSHARGASRVHNSSGSTYRLIFAGTESPATRARCGRWPANRASAEKLYEAPPEQSYAVGPISRRGARPKSDPSKMVSEITAALRQAKDNRLQTVPRRHDEIRFFLSYHALFRLISPRWTNFAFMAAIQSKAAYRSAARRTRLCPAWRRRS